MRNDKSKSLKRPSIQYIFFFFIFFFLFYRHILRLASLFIYIPRLNFQTFVILAASERVDDDNESMAKVRADFWRTASEAAVLLAAAILHM